MALLGPEVLEFLVKGTLEAAATPEPGGVVVVLARRDQTPLLTTTAATVVRAWQLTSRARVRLMRAAVVVAVRLAAVLLGRAVVALVVLDRLLVTRVL